VAIFTPSPSGTEKQVIQMLDGRRLCGAKIEQGVEYAEA